MNDTLLENAEMVFSIFIMIIAYTIFFVIMIISIFILAFMSVFVYENNRVKEMVKEMFKK